VSVGQRKFITKRVSSSARINPRSTAKEYLDRAAAAGLSWAAAEGIHGAAWPRALNTRAAYAVAVRGFFAWLDQREIRELGAIRTHHVSAYIETLTRTYKAPTVKQHLAAIRMLFDWLIVGQVVEQNPAAAVRRSLDFLLLG
jgi:hypothetical protein